jgi:YegS/Rv2252/BmrU family lipid kinase
MTDVNDAMPDLKKSICFIINPKSGRRRHAAIGDLITANIDSDKFRVFFYYTAYAGHAAQLSREAINLGMEIIVAVGGDGTINEVAGEMIGSNAALGIIPTGSGNGLARHLNIPFSVKRAIRLINTTHLDIIDTGVVNDRFFISLAGVGFDALVAKHFENSSRRGFLTYFMIIANRYFKYKPKKYKLTFDDGVVIVTRALFITAANSNQFGYNTTIAPNARLNDGLLDVVIVSKPKIFELPIIANLLLLKRIDLSPGVKIIPTTGVTISRSKNKVVNIDGEALKLRRKLRIKINPKSLNIIIPEHGQKR